MSTVNIKGLSRAAVFAALYNMAKPQGMGFLHYDPKPMTEAEAAELCQKQESFDYVKGRVMKVSIPIDAEEIDVRWYDRDNGAGSAALAIEQLRKSGIAEGGDIARNHELHTRSQAEYTESRLREKTRVEPGYIALGIGDYAEHLKPALDKILKK